MKTFKHTIEAVESHKEHLYTLQRCISRIEEVCPDKPHFIEADTYNLDCVIIFKAENEKVDKHLEINVSIKTGKFYVIVRKEVSAPVDYPKMFYRATTDLEHFVFNDLPDAFKLLEK